MRKRLLCFCLSLVLALGCLSPSAWAGGADAQTGEADQAMLNELIEPILDGFGFSEMTSDLKKVTKIYNYVTSHVTYDSGSGNHSAYEALTNGTASSQGIACLVYQMLTGCGVPAEIITGTENGANHTWTIVQLQNVSSEGGAVYYALDAALDAGVDEEEYKYFLRCDSSLANHDRDPEFSTDVFQSSYPMAQKDFDLACWETHYYWSFDFTWSGDLSTVRGTSKCELCWGLFSEKCTVTSSILQEATHTQPGEVCYEAVITIDGVKMASQQKVVTTDKTEGHVFNHPQWSWSETGEGYSAQAVFYCTGDDGYSQRVNAAVTTEEVAGTCQQAASVTYTASALFQGETYTDRKVVEGEKGAHSYESLVTPPTCTEQGSTTHTCTLCGDCYSDSKTEELGHSVTEFTVTREPTAAEAGEKAGVCTRCGERITEEIPALDQEGEAPNENPDDDPNGEPTESPDGEHQHYYTGVTVEATCTEPGGVHYTCTCGDSHIEDEVPALGHSFSDFKVTISATCTTPGEITGYCARCGLSAPETIPAAGHSFTSQNIPATCTQQGFTSHTCTTCGYEMRDGFTDLAEHSYDDGVVTLEPAAGREGKMTYTCQVCGDTYAVGISSVENPFLDVAASAFYYQPVLWAFRNEVTSGVDSTHFAPETTCTRGHVVTFLWRTMGCPEPQAQTSPFVDVTADQYYYKAVLWAYETGITTGIDLTHFGPDVTVNRAQVVTFLYRTAGSPGVSGGNPFADVFRVDYYQNAVLWAYENGITAGMDESHFAPGSPCTRGQVVTFLYRYRMNDT